MEQDIKLKGVTASPSDLDCADGELAQCHNLTNDFGALEAMRQPETLATLPAGTDILHVHRTAGTDTYILRDSDGHIYHHRGLPANGGTFPASSQAARVMDETEDERAKTVTSIGNTLVILTDTTTRHFLYKRDTNSYTDLGAHIPEIPISFGLKARPVLASAEKTGLHGYAELESGYLEHVTDEHRMKFTETVFSIVNKTVNEQGPKIGRFTLPFLVRYALRLYDGTLTMHSAPVFMTLNTNGPAVPLFDNIYVDTMLLSAKLQYAAHINNEDRQKLALWGDIVKSVDIFVSKPIYPYDPSGGPAEVAYAGWDAPAAFTYKFKNSKTVCALEFDGFEGPTNSQDGQTFTPSKRKIRRPFMFNNATLGETDNNFQYDNSDPRNFASKNSVGNILRSTHAEWDLAQIFAMFYSSGGRLHFEVYSGHNPNAYAVLPPPKDGKTLEELIADTANFYLVKSIPTQDLAASLTDVDIPEGYLETLATREAMTDDYLSHDTLAAEFAHVYNNRLNIASVTRAPFRGFHPDTMTEITNTAKPWCDSEAYIARFNPEDGSQIWKTLEHSLSHIHFTEYVSCPHTATVTIKENGTTHTVAARSLEPSAPIMSIFGNIAGGGNTEAGLMSHAPLVFYPNPNATEMLVTAHPKASSTGDGQNPHISLATFLTYTETDTALLRPISETAYNGLGDTSYRIPLKPHPFLNGAYGILATGHTREPSAAIPATPTGTRIEEPSKLYTSEVNNPFVFRPENINTIGTSRIKAISTAAAPLSEGQFGQFPLYAFTEDGIWALSVNAASGGFSTVQPITRDACLSAGSVTQIDNSVIFATRRGIMEISGSKTKCVTDELNASAVFDTNTLPGFQELFPGGLDATGQTIAEFLDAGDGARAAYDYANQRITIFNPAKHHAYTLSMRTRLWTSSDCQLLHTLNTYPDTLAVARSSGASGTRRVVNLSKPDTLNPTGVIVTRPVKLGAPNTLKTARALIVRGQFQTGSVKTILYGSRDLTHWHLVKSSANHMMRTIGGTPYKFFRIAIIASLMPGEYVSGVTIQHEARHTNRLR